MSEQGKNANHMPFFTWGMLLMGMLSYGLILFLVGGMEESETFGQGFPVELFWGLVVASIVMVPAIKVVREKLFFRDFKSLSFEDSNFADPYFTVSITTWAMAEAIAIFGFLLSLLSGEMIYFIGFALPSIVLFLIYRPQLGSLKEDYEKRLKEAKGSSADPYSGKGW